MAEIVPGIDASATFAELTGGPTVFSAVVSNSICTREPSSLEGAESFSPHPAYIKKMMSVEAAKEQSVR